MKKSKKNQKKTNKLITLIASLVVILGGGIGITIAINNHGIDVKIEYSETPVITGDEGANEEEIPTVEEIDGGGKFKDKINLENAESAIYYELGSIEDVDTSSPLAFKNSTIGRCIIADNYYGAQCVSLARAFWWSYAGFDVSTCGTGLAKGMMNCADENARDKFKVIWDTKDIQAGTWLVFDGATTGHVCMALGDVNNGYVSCLGENQGGANCGVNIGGSATNIINLSVKNFIGGYTPKTYIIPEPTPEPTPDAPDTGVAR